MSDLQKKLKKLAERRHPDYEKNLSHWDFLELCYSGDRGWFKKHIFQYLKEGPDEFKDRVNRAYRFNHSKEIVDLVNKYIFKSKIWRNEENAPDAVKNFWKKSNRSGSSPIQKFIRELAKSSSIYGRVWVVVDRFQTITPILDDNNEPTDEGILGDGRTYAYIVKPQNVLDMSYDDDGELNWILIRESFRNDNDPLESDGKVYERYRLWDRENWTLITPTISKVQNGKESITYTSIVGVHGLGVVPVFPHDHNECEELYTSPSLICDIAYLDRACSNYLSNLDAIIQDQTFSQLAMPAQGLMPGESAYTKMIEAGTNRIFCYDGGEGGSAPFFLSPDPKQAELIISAISKLINEIYHTVGMAGERTKEDNSVGIDNSSGVAKAYDFERVNALLTTKAASLKLAEIKIIELVLNWENVVAIDNVQDLVIYPETFDVRGIASEFSIASNLIAIESPIEMRKEQMRILAKKLFPMISKAKMKKMEIEIEEMVDMAIPMIPQNYTEQDTGTDNVPSLKGNRQGENNKTQLPKG